MRAPQTKTLFFVAIVLFVLTSISIAPNYPAPFPVLGADGKPLIDPDGKPIVHRDMASYYRDMIPALIFLAGSLFAFGWWILRIVKLTYGRIAASKN
jgi:hypothetical protein